MKQKLGSTCCRINPAQVRPFVKIAPMARQRKVIKSVGTIVLAGNDVLNVMPQFAVFLAQPAILASFASAINNKPADSRIHLLRSPFKMLAGFCFENCDKIGRVDQRFVF